MRVTDHASYLEKQRRRAAHQRPKLDKTRPICRVRTGGGVTAPVAADLERPLPASTWSISPLGVLGVLMRGRKKRCSRAA